MGLFGGGESYNSYGAGSSNSYGGSYGSEPSFSWIKFFILFVPFTIFSFWFAPTMKWKLLFPLAGAVGIYLALVGKSMRKRK